MNIYFKKYDFHQAISLYQKSLTITIEVGDRHGQRTALESLGKDAFSIGEIPPTPGLVDEYFNDSTGEGDDGEMDATGPWNEGGNWRIVEQPELQLGVETRMGGAKLKEFPKAGKPRAKRMA